MNEVILKGRLVSQRADNLKILVDKQIMTVQLTRGLGEQLKSLKETPNAEITVYGKLIMNSNLTFKVIVNQVTFSETEEE